ncbi:MAG: hypothetical protein HY286_13630 [Planctomycetes bacterium]|nr:hypothetical protein [Planctomycetota bacterium]
MDLKYLYCSGLLLAWIAGGGILQSGGAAARSGTGVQSKGTPDDKHRLEFTMKGATVRQFVINMSQLTGHPFITSGRTNDAMHSLKFDLSPIEVPKAQLDRFFERELSKRFFILKTPPAPGLPWSIKSDASYAYDTFFTVPESDMIKFAESLARIITIVPLYYASPRDAVAMFKPPPQEKGPEGFTAAALGHIIILRGRGIDVYEASNRVKDFEYKAKTASDLILDSGPGKSNAKALDELAEKLNKRLGALEGAVAEVKMKIESAAGERTGTQK